MTTIYNKKNFTVTIDGTEKKFCVTRPDNKLKEKAQLFKAKKIRETAEGGALLREEVDKLLRDRKIWDDEKEKLFFTLAKTIKEDEEKLLKAKSTKKAKLSEMKDLAVKTAANFQALQSLQMERSSLDHLTAEGIAASAEFDFQLSNCIKNEDGTNYYASYEDMIERENCPVYDGGKGAFLDLLYGPYEDQLKKRPEWKFLLDHKFVNNELRLIDKNGNLIDGAGRKVDSKGRLINDKGELINENGELVDELGFLIPSEEGYFLDDDGDPIKE